MILTAKASPGADCGRAICPFLIDQRNELSVTDCAHDDRAADDEHRGSREAEQACKTSANGDFPIDPGTLHIRD